MRPSPAAASPGPSQPPVPGGGPRELPGTGGPPPALSRAADEALEVQRAANAHIIHRVRLVGVTALLVLFAVLGLGVGLPDWRDRLTLAVPYWVLSLAVAAGAGHSSRVERSARWALLVVDLPMTFLIQWTSLERTHSPDGVAGFTVGFLLLLVVLVSLTLDARAIRVACAEAALLEGLLQRLAGVEWGAVVATGLLFTLAAWALGWGVERARTLVLRAVEAQGSAARAEKLAAIGAVAGGIGHDLRNPLASATMALELMRSRLEGSVLAQDAAAARRMQVLARELEACRRLVEGLLDFARERPVQRAPCPLRPLVDEALDVVRAPDSIRFLNEVPEALPVPQLDRGQLREVLVNLLQNAAEAVPRGSEGRVRVRAHVVGDRVTLEVEDNGSGIPEDVQQHLFEPLFTTKESGTGFGLAMARSILERHQGRLWLESRVGEGTTFHLELPLAPGA